MKNRDPKDAYNVKNLLIKNPYWRTFVPVITGMALAGLVLGRAKQTEYR